MEEFDDKKEEKMGQDSGKETEGASTEQKEPEEGMGNQAEQKKTMEEKEVHTGQEKPPEGKGAQAGQEKPPERGKEIQVTRHVIQVISFVLFPTLLLTVLSSLGAIVRAVMNGSFTLSGMSGSLILAGGLFLVTILWGRFFCGYFCSFGTVGELIYFLSKKIMPKKWKISEKMDKRLKYIKYLVLAYLVIGVWIFSLPLAVFTRNGRNSHGWMEGHGHMASLYGKIGIIILIGILAGSFFIERFFCRYLCPLGAIFTPLSKLRLFKIRRDYEGCGGCSQCSEGCSMGLPVHEKKKVTSGECIECMHCISDCPEQKMRSKSSSVAAGIIVAVVTVCIIFAGQAFPGTKDGKQVYTSKGKAGNSYEGRPDRKDFGEGRSRKPDLQSPDGHSDRFGQRGDSSGGKRSFGKGSGKNPEDGDSRNWKRQAPKKEDSDSSDSENDPSGSKSSPAPDPSAAPKADHALNYFH